MRVGWFHKRGVMRSGSDVKVKDSVRAWLDFIVFLV
jgi:hypothetical protein